MSKAKAKPESEEVTTEAVESIEPPCPIRSEFENVELTPEQDRVMRIMAEVSGVSRDTYLRVFSHGANFARLTA